MTVSRWSGELTPPDASTWSEVAGPALSARSGDYLKLGAACSRQEVGQARHMRHPWPGLTGSQAVT